MKTRLEDLLHSLTTILVRFHDAQPKIKVKLITDSDPLSLPKKSRQEAIRILEDSVTPFDIRLKEIISICNKVYPERTSFLNFMLNQITYLKTMNDRKNSFNPTELEEYKKQVAQMLLDFRQLLLTIKDKTHDVKYSRIKTEIDSTPEMPISLSGLVNNAYVGNHFCNSGILLNTEVLERLHLHVPLSAPSSTEESNAIAEINLLADRICTAHQNTLLVPELIAEKSRLEELANSQKLTIESHSSGLLQIELTAKKQDETVKSLTSLLEQAELREKELTLLMSTLNDKLQISESSLEKHSETILALTEKLQLTETGAKKQTETILSLTEKCQLAETGAKKQSETILTLTEKCQLAETGTKKQSETILSLTEKLEQSEAQLSELLATISQQKETISSLSIKPVPIGLAYGSFFGLNNPHFNQFKQKHSQSKESDASNLTPGNE